MRNPSNRRRFLSTLAGVGIAPLTGIGRVAATTHVGDVDDGFRPVRHGFGFRNWNVEDSEMTVRAETIEEAGIIDTIRDDWNDLVAESLGLSVENFPDLLVSAIARQIYVSVNQLSGTNGHCYGMVFTAQRYFESPDAIPVDRAMASEIHHPAEPLDDSTFNPVLDDIEWFHRSQYLDFYSWLGRRASFRPSWIDYQVQLRDLRAVVDEFGTAGISLIDAGDSTQHQVLVYDYHDHDTGTTLEVYDPNRPAPRYANESGLARIEIDTTAERPRMQPYAKGYDHFVYNRYDRIVRARAEETTPFERFTVGSEGFRSLLSSIALFLVASPTVSLAVIGPDGRPLSRDRSTVMDTDVTEYDDMRYRYGADPGTYRVVLLGEDDGEYTLSAIAGSIEGDLLDDSVDGSIAVGEVHRYEVIVPGSSDEAGTIRRVRAAEDRPSALLAAVGGAGATAVAGGAYWIARNRIAGDRDG